MTMKQLSSKESPVITSPGRNPRQLGELLHLRYCLTGYAGFVRGSQHFYGSSYGNVTSVATQHDFSQPEVSSGLPSSPHMVRPIPETRRILLH